MRAGVKGVLARLVLCPGGIACLYRWTGRGHGGMKMLSEWLREMRMAVAGAALETVLPCCICCQHWSEAVCRGSWGREGGGQWPHSCRACDPLIHSRWILKTTEWWFGSGRTVRTRNIPRKLKMWSSIGGRAGSGRPCVSVAMGVGGTTSCEK